MENATALFRERKEIRGLDNFRHSESRWSSIAQMAFIWMSKQGNMSLNIFKSEYNIDKNNWLEKDGKLLIDNWIVSNSIVEGRIKDLFPNEQGMPDMKPDITLLESVNNNTEIILIEVKTVGTGVEKNLENYKKLKDYINENIDGYSCSLYYLMPFGHEKDFEWGLLDNSNEKILLWEDLLLKIHDSPLMEYIALDIDINQWKEFKGFLSEE